MNLSCPETVSELESQVQRALNDRIADFRLIVREQGLILQGKSWTYYAKQLAQHLAMEATGSPILANQIEVLAR
jgi:hypothetical protein